MLFVILGAFYGIAFQKNEAFFVNHACGAEDCRIAKVQCVLTGQRNCVIAEGGEHTVTAQCAADETFAVLLVQRQAFGLRQCLCSTVSPETAVYPSGRRENSTADAMTAISRGMTISSSFRFMAVPHFPFSLLYNIGSMLSRCLVRKKDCRKQLAAVRKNRGIICRDVPLRKQWILRHSS